MPRWISLGFQDASSPVLMEFVILHDHIMVIIVLVIVLVSYILMLLMFSSFFYKYISEGTFIETIWSIIPAFLLIVLVVPSIKVLYLMEDVKIPSLSFKVIGHQWYWSYSSQMDNELLSWISNENEHKLFFRDFMPDWSYEEYDASFDTRFNVPRLLSCNIELVLPISTSCRLLVRSRDVIHAFSVPSLGLKIDAVPGRVNQIFVNPFRQGIYFGQCSEICGSYHSFMPISVEVFRIDEYNSYLAEITSLVYLDCETESLINRYLFFRIYS